MPQRPICFVLMPFGVKKDPVTQVEIDFDAIYANAIRPAIDEAGMDPIRADEERTGGIIHKPMFERLLLCDFAVADLTTGNFNVAYELGVRHAVRPCTTVALFAEGQRLPFDLTFLRSLPYALGANGSFSEAEAEALKNKLKGVLAQLVKEALKEPPVDSPLFQLLTEYRAPDVAHMRAEVFRERVEYSESLKKRLTEARRNKDEAAVEEVYAQAGGGDTAELGVLVDVFLAWRALSRFDKMVDLYPKLPGVLQRAVTVREQFAFALNRLGKREEALDVLQGVLKDQGPSSETLGLIGRIYKDRWTEARRAGRNGEARGHLNQAIDAYGKGFEADQRDAFPGVNAVTLLEIKGDAASQARKQELLPVVRYAAAKRVRDGKPDYWDHATLVELAVLEGDEASATAHLDDALAMPREPFFSATTANNLSLIQEARKQRGVEEAWLSETIETLRQAG